MRNIILTTALISAAFLAKQKIISAEDSIDAAPAITALNEVKFIVTTVPAEVRTSYKLADFYQKHVDFHGFPILGSKHVAYEALLEAAAILQHLLCNRADLLAAINAQKIRLCVMSPEEQTTDVPEHSDLTPKEYWDRRARGLGATRIRPAVNCGAENLLNLKDDRYPQENILIHEFSHVIHEQGLGAVDKDFQLRLDKVYRESLANGLWKGTYAAENDNEFWAETAQCYFDCNNSPNHDHNDVNTRAELKEYDPAAFVLADDVFRQNPWRYKRYDARNKTNPPEIKSTK